MTDVFDPVTVEAPEVSVYDPVSDTRAGLDISSSKSKERSKVLLPAVTTLDEETVEQAVDTNNSFIVDEEARKAGRAKVAENSRRAFQDSFEAQEDPVEAINRLRTEIENDPFISKFVDPAVMATVLEGDNELAKKAYLDKFQKVVVLADVMNKAQKEADDPWYRDFDFVDAVFSSLPVVGNINANKRIEAAEKISNLLTSDLTPDQFADEASKLFAQVADQGLFTDNNKLYLADLFELLDHGGRGGEAATQQFWAWFDTATILGAGATSLVRGGVRQGLSSEMAGAASDVSTLVAKTTGDKDVIKSVLGKAAADDNPATSPTSLSNKGPSAITPLHHRKEYLSAPEAVALRELEQDNQLLQTILRDGLPEGTEQELFEEFAETLVSARRAANEEAGKARIIDYDVEKSSLENVFYTELLGTAKGAYFKSRPNAERLAADVSGEVVPVSGSEWAVKVTENIPLQKGSGNTLEDLRLYLGTDHQELGTGFWSRWGSPLAQTTARLNAILKQAEAKRAAFGELLEVNLKASRKGMKTWEINNVERTYEELNYGRFADTRNPLSTDEFDTMYFEVHGKKMNAKQRNLYETLQEFNDAAYYLEADLIFKDAVNRGVKVLDTGTFQTKVIQVADRSRVPADELVWDVDKKKMVRFEDVKEDTNVFSTAENLFEDATGTKAQYIVSKGSPTRRLYHSDVLAYNPGGPRTNVPGSVKVFVKQDRETVLSSGRVVRENPRTILGVRLTDEAGKATDQLNAIGTFLRDRLPSAAKGRELAKAIRAMGKDAELEDLLRKNNEFNPALQTADDIAEFIERTGWNPRQDVDWAFDGSELGAGGASFLPGIDPTRTVAEQVRFNSRGRAGRKDQLLLGYGGRANVPVRQMASLERNFSSVAARRTEAGYVSAAVHGLVRGLLENPKALKKSLDSDLAGLPLRAKLRRLDEYINDTDEGQKFKLERDKIEFRLQHRPLNNVWFQKWKEDVADKLYARQGNSRLVQTIDMYSSDPISALKGYVFDAWLGLFAWDQFYVQASQIFNIVGMSPLRGLQGAAAYSPTRFALLNGNKEVLEKTAKAVAPVLGVKPEEYVKIVEMLRRDGRLVTGLSVTELGEESAYTGVLRGIRDKGRIFFNEGEITARITGHLTASLEYIAKFGSKNLDEQHGRRWIAHRQDTLTNAMTSASRAPFQRAPFTQFLSYSWRVGEAMFAGSLGGKSVLSNKEKLTLAAAHMTIYGAAGIPAAGALMDKLNHKYGVSVPEDYYAPVRYGAIDMALTSLIGAETAASTRLAWGEGIYDYMANFSDKNFLEALGGPAATFAADTSGAMFKLMGSIFSADPKEIIQTDFIQLARQFKSANMTHNTYLAIMLGDYVARNGGSIIKDDVNAYETIALAFGVPLADVVERRKVDNMMFNDSQFEKKVGKDIDALLVQHRLAVEAENFDSADVFRKQIALVLNALTPSQKQRVMRNIRPSVERMESTTYWAIQRDYKNSNFIGDTND